MNSALRMHIEAKLLSFQQRAEKAEEKLRLREEQLTIATEALQNLVNEFGEGQNMGKSWSEYQIDDSVIAEARAALEKIKGE